MFAFSGPRFFGAVRTGASRWLAALLIGTALTPLTDAAALAQKTSGTLQGLGYLVGGPANFDQAFAVDANGSVVVGESALPGGLFAEAFRWTQSGGMQGLGVIGSGGAATDSTANGVSANGSVVVGTSSYDGVAYQYEAFRWTESTGMVGLGFIGNRTIKSSAAYAVSADGSVVVGATTWSGKRKAEAFRWTQATGMVGLGSLGSAGRRLHRFSIAEAVSADGSVVVGETTKSKGVIEAFQWTQSRGMVGLGFLVPVGRGGAISTATGVSADGSVVVGESTFGAAGAGEAFRWTQSGGMVGLGVIGGAANSTSEAFGVNGNGSVIVGQNISAPDNLQAFRWTQATGVRSLSSLLTAAGVNLGGWSLTNASAVSADGQFIVGQETKSSGGQPYAVGQPYLARYIDATVNPPPPTPLPSPPPSPVIAGVTTLASVQGSIDQVEGARQALMVQEHGLAAELLGENNPIGAGSEIGVFAQVGSAEGGGVARIAFGNGLTLLGGLAYQGDSLKGVSIDDALMGALALRYVYGAPGGIRPFAEIGGWTAPDANFTFTRTYANGAGIAVGDADAEGSVSYLFGRAGAAFNVTRLDEAALSAEIGGQWMRTGAYSETLSPIDPFEAYASSATSVMTVGKIRAQWTHDFTDKIDATVWAAGADALGSSTNLVVTVPGFGALTPSNAGRPVWAEYGARVGYRLTANSTIDVFADGATGAATVGTAVHVGADFRYVF